MNNELTAKLNEKYPKMFLFHNFRSASHFIFECRDGWYNIVNMMLSNINNYVQNNNDRYWKFDDAQTLIDNKRTDLVPKYLLIEMEKINNGNGEYPIEMDFPVVKQIKEKFGTLRVYLEGYDNVIAEITNSAESMSITTCEECGNIGEIRKFKWIKTLCDPCAELREQKILADEIAFSQAGTYAG